MKGAVKNRTRRAFGKVLAYIIPMLLILGAAVYLLSLAGDKIEEMEGQITALLKETEHVEIQRVQIEEKLELISELATSSFEYTNQKTISNTRQLLGFDIPGTTNTVELIYSGIIKVGYDVSEIECVADEENLQLIFTLPEARVLKCDPHSRVQILGIQFLPWTDSWSADKRLHQSFRNVQVLPYRYL